MNEALKQNLRRIEIAALIIFTLLLIAIVGHNKSAVASRLPTTVLLTSDTNGIPRFHGVSLANPYLKRGQNHLF
jgi:hypothetical protein